MDINEIFKTTKTTLPVILSEYMEMQCDVKGTLNVIIKKLAKNDPAKEKKLFNSALVWKEKKIQHFIARKAKD